MITALQAILNSIDTPGFTSLLVNTALKSFLVLGLAGVVCLALRRASAATRHFIWFSAVLSLPFLPLLSQMLPTWHKPLWSLSSDTTSGNEMTLTFAFTSGANSGTTFGERPDSPKVNAQAETAARSETSRFKARFNAGWVHVILAIWATGFMVVLYSILISRRRIRILSRQARQLSAGKLPLLLEDACQELRVRRNLTLFQSAQDVMPVTWGWWRPVVLLPAQADNWTDERCRIVLMHEVAHVKRLDCLTQFITSLVCALYWFNPIVWLAARAMCAERERACDDLVLNGGCKASDYATHLLEIARAFRPIPQTAAIAMARSSQLETRIAAIVDGGQARRAPNIVLFSLGSITVLGLVAGLAAQQPGENGSLRKQQFDRLEVFSAVKEKQAMEAAEERKESLHPDYRVLFEAARKGDAQTVTNLYVIFKQRHPQYNSQDPDKGLATSHWQAVLEICLAYYDVAAGEPTFIQMAVDDIFASIPPGSIYFGGTDPGRGLPTAFSRSHADADPFFTLTQNALADDSYLAYLRRTYGAKLSIPTDADSKNHYDDYTSDAVKRLEHDQKYPNEPKQVKPGEDIRLVNGKAQVKGQVAVMAINGLLTKTIFDRNPDKEFYIEESFPLDWMYPHLSPNGLILKINREPLASLSEEIVRKDQEFWQSRMDAMVGDWLVQDTPVATITEFVEKVYVRRDLAGFKGDPAFIRNSHPQKMFSKWRSAIAGVYAWRIMRPTNPAEQRRMIAAADFAFRQAFALCPSSPEAIYRYVNFLIAQGRVDDAILLVEAARKVDPAQKQLNNLSSELNRIKDQKSKLNSPTERHR